MARALHAERGRRLRILLGVLAFGVVGAAGVVALSLAEYRFLVVEHSVELYVALVASLFAAVGIWLGRTLRRREPPAVAAPVPPAPEPFVPDAARISALEITPRELEILGLVAAGLSNREIGERLFVSENTVKTHCSRLFDKLGAKRRTQAIQIGREKRLIP
ncbi:MAG: regulatory protein LuxR [Acidobacteria bacterium]|nr:regulatory protein LuxR [Acidobacteriota bacterium]